RYIETGIPTDDYTQELENAVNRVRRNEKWRLDYMTLYLKQQESYMDGKEEGIAEGISEGITRGMEQKSLEIAKALLDVLDMPTVAVKTGLPVEVVQELKADSPDEGKR
ncbi:MAG: hypothetical protein NC089_06730, partial [Bacteroides sp.]|nr:hypothetical protein [Bacteroides sp.]